jgi:hypothetical protein
MLSQPSRKDVDAVAHFTQAARELSSQPLFDEDHSKIYTEGYVAADNTVEITHARLPSKMVRDAAIIPFRRIWMSDEPSFYRNVINCVKRYSPALCTRMEDLELEIKKSLRSHWDPWTAKNAASVTPEDVVNLWLNTRIAHTGTQQSRKFTRSDFESTAKQIGELRFEMLFIQALLKIGGCYIEMLPITEELLENTWKTAGITPSFAFDHVCEDGVHSFSDGTRIVRSSPYLLIERETRSQRIQRLIDRWAFATLQRFFMMLEAPIEELCDELARAKDLDAFLDGLGFRQLDADDAPPHATRKRGTTGMLDLDSRLIWKATIFDTGDIYLDANAKCVLKRQISQIAAT